MPCGEKCCCALGGCGCPPGSDEQLHALAQIIEEAMEGGGALLGKKDGYLAAAGAVLEVFGTGPQTKRLKELGLWKKKAGLLSGTTAPGGGAA